MALRVSTGFRNKRLGKDTEMIQNGEFTSATTGWTAVDASLSSVGGGVSGNCLRITESGSANPGKAYQDLTTVAGRLYLLQLYFKKGTSDYGSFRIGTPADDSAIFVSKQLNDATWTLYTVGFVAVDTTTRITLVTDDATAGEYSDFDSVSVVDKSNSFKDIFKDCYIRIYTGSQPASADDAPTGTLLCTFYSDGASLPLEWDDAASGVISKKSTETWTGTAVATGTAGWFRISVAGDPGTSSTIWERIDGACATSGAQMNMSSTSIVSGAVQTITSALITDPASA